MQVIFNGKNAPISDREQEYVVKKLARLSRYFREPREVYVTHSVQRNWQIVEMLVDLDGVMVRSEERTNDILTSVDAVVARLEKQVRRLKSRMRQHKGRPDAPLVAKVLTETPEPDMDTRDAERLPDAGAPGAGAPDDDGDAGFWTDYADAEEPEEAEPERTLVRRKRIAIKPMTADDAALQMDMLHHDFFAFVDVETNQASVLYRRRDGDYGLLELGA